MFFFAIAVIIDNCQGVLADGERIKIIFFQGYDCRTGHGGIFIRCDKRTVHLDAGEFGEISVRHKIQCAVTVLRPVPD